MKRITYETFLAVSRLRHFRKAADHLNTTQSNVSMRIAALERQLGAELFVRGAQAATLTPLGRELVPLAEDVLRQMDAFAQAAGQDPDQEGTLRLALSETIVTLILPEFLRRFSAAFPKAKVTIMVDTTTFQRQRLLDRTVDLACLMGPISEYEVANLPLLDVPLIWAAAPDHPVAQAGVLTIDDVKTYPLLSYSNTSRPFAELNETLAALGVRRPQIVSVNALSATIGMTKAGIGVSTVPHAIAQPYLDAGEIVQVRSDIPLNDLRFTASYVNDTVSGLAKSAARLAQEIAEETQRAL